MHAYRNAGAGRTTRRGNALWRHARGALVAAALIVSACSPTDILDVTDPDIINPEDVRSPAGANAARIGALARFNTATSGGESLLLLGGLFADEWINGDSFIHRQDVDRRSITEDNTFLTTANRALHRARLSAEQAIALMAEWIPEAPEYQVAEMHLIQAYVVNILAEHYCDGLVFSTVDENANPVYGTPITTAEAFGRALGHANDGLALTFDDNDPSQAVLNSLRVLKGRILLNLDQYDEAAAAVADVPTDFAYVMQHSATTNSNEIWVLNNNSFRYSVGNAEGGNGINFATANDPRVPVCHGGDAACRAIGVTRNRRDDDGTPYHVQMLWPARESPVVIMSGIEARLMEAEAALAANDPDGMVTILNSLRSQMGGGPADLTDPGTADGRVDLLFRERALWLFGRGTRTGDLRRLIRQYQRAEDDVFPTGVWHKSGNYADDVTMPIPFAETNNPNLENQPATCLNRNP